MNSHIITLVKPINISINRLHKLGLTINFNNRRRHSFKKKKKRHTSLVKKVFGAPVGIKNISCFLYLRFTRKAKRINPLFRNKLISFWPSIQKRNEIWFLKNSYRRGLYRRPIQFYNKLFSTNNEAVFKSTIFTKKNKFMPLWGIYPASAAHGSFEFPTGVTNTESVEALYKKRSSNSRKQRQTVADFNQGVIRIFWKSQAVFKVLISEKRRWTTRKFFHVHNRWYKMHKKDKKITNLGPLWVLLLKCGLFLSRSDCEIGVKSGLIKLANHANVTIDHEMEVGNIVCFPVTYLTQLLLTSRYKKKIKSALSYRHKIFMRNKASQWKQTRKNHSSKIKNLIYNRSQYPNYVQLCVSNGVLSIVKPHTMVWGINLNYSRHNLEKLNTWKLNV